ncbi:MAG: dihydroneopterin aldolase [Hyphomonadaceae bacterium]|nr:dihydroneopterin aldolase [Hyphomonadaceae bacterium]
MIDELAIILTDIPVSLHLGVPRAERERPQTVLISLTMARRDPAPFGADARLGDTIDYARVIAFLKEGLPARGPFVLVETIAETVAAYARDLAGPDACVAVDVKKPSVLGKDGLVTVRLVREGAR